MRFKKLKISVAIALMIFILVIGNIYIFGLINNNSLNSNPVSAPIYTDKSAAIIQQPSQQLSTTQESPQVSQPTTIVHRTVVSRAS